MRKVHQITSIQDLDKLFSLSRGTFYVIKFSAIWCKPCQELKERYFQLAQNYQNIVFIDVDIDNDDTDSTVKISEYFKVNNLPTIIVARSEGNLPNSDNVDKIILQTSEGKDLSSLIYFLNNLNYDINSKKEPNDVSIDRFHPPNINFTREIGYDSNLNDNVYGHFIEDRNNSQPSENDSVNYFPYSN
jgi:thiol-disulfide isomerase/thioredoxin